MIPLLLNQLSYKKLIANMNGFIVLVLAGSISLHLLISTTATRLTTVTSIVYICVAALIALNWRTNLRLRKSIAYCGFILILSMAIGISHFEYLVKFLFITVMLLISITTISTIKVSIKVMNAIGIMMLLLLFTFLLQSFGYYEMYFQSLSTSGESLLNNPNSMGLIMLFAYILFDRSNLAKSPIVRFISLLVSILGMLNFGSRGAIVCLVIYLLVQTVVKARHMRTRKILFGIVVLLGLTFPLIYIYNYAKTDSVQSSTQILGKNVYSGRQDVWSSAINDERQNYLIGSRNTDLFESFPSESVHNMYLDLQFKLGVPFLLLFLLVIYFSIIKNEEIGPKTYAAILIVFIYGFFESSFSAGNLSAMLMTLVFIDPTQNNGQKTGAR